MIGIGQKNIEDATGAGGYVASLLQTPQTPQYNFDFSGTQSDADEKRVAHAASKASVFTQQSYS